jgi:hypothetical protein
MNNSEKSNSFEYEFVISQWINSFCGSANQSISTTIDVIHLYSIEDFELELL